MATRLIPAHMTFLDANGDPLSGGKLNFYTTGTTTPKDTFSDEALTSANANPIVLDSAGRVGGDVWGSGDFKLVIENSADVQQGSFDPLLGAAISGVIAAADNIAFTGNNTHSGTETFTGNVEVDDADLMVTLRDPTITTKSAKLGIASQETFHYRLEGLDENTTRQWFKFTIADIAQVTGKLTVHAILDGPIPAGSSYAEYKISQLTDGAGPVANANLIASSGSLALGAPVVSGNDVIIGGNIPTNGTSPTLNDIHFYITLIADDTTSFTFAGLTGSTAHTGSFVKDSVTFGRDLDPLDDNTYDVGSASKRVKEYFGVNTTINSSGRKLKGFIKAPDPKALTAISAVPLQTFKWNDAIAEKGEAKARDHAGIVAEDLIASFEAQGLNAGDYGVFVRDFDEDGNEILMIRPVEFLFLRLAAAEARLAALEPQ